MDSDKRKRTGIRRYGLWLIIAIFLGTTGLVGAGIEAKSHNPVFCASCHEASTDTWSHSTHQTVSCRDCHRTVDLSRMFGGYLTGAKEQTTRRAAQELQEARNCSGCHPPDRETRHPDLTVAHGIHAAMTVECVQCHVSPGHDDATAGVERENCLKCHNGAMAPATCETCHLTEPEQLAGEGGQ